MPLKRDNSTCQRAPSQGYVQCDSSASRQGQAREKWRSTIQRNRRAKHRVTGDDAHSAPRGGQRNGRGRVRGPLQKRSEPLAAVDMAPLRVRALRSRPVRGDFEMSTVLTHPEITPRRLDCLAGLRIRTQESVREIARRRRRHFGPPARRPAGMEARGRSAQKDLALGAGRDAAIIRRKRTLFRSADDRCVWLHVFWEIVICGPRSMPKA